MRRHVEELRLAEALGREALARFDFPAGEPPFPLVLLVLPETALDLTGRSLAWPRVRLAQELTEALVREGFATLRTPARHWMAAWKRALSHSLVSKARLLWAPLGDALSSVAAGKREAVELCEPSGVVLVLPPDDAGRHLPRLAPLPLSAVAAGRRLRASVDGRPGNSSPPVTPASAPLAAQVLDDATENGLREADWRAGRPIVHPELLSAVVAAARAAIRPPWERPARPAGIAIGPAGTPLPENPHG